MDINFEKHLNLPLYYESEKQEIIKEVREAIKRSSLGTTETSTETSTKYSVIDIRNSILKQNAIEDIDDDD